MFGRAVLWKKGSLILLAVICGLALLITVGQKVRTDAEAGVAENWVKESDDLYWKLDLESYRGVFIGDEIQTTLQIRFNSQKLSFSEKDFFLKDSAGPFLVKHQEKAIFLNRGKNWEEAYFSFVLQPLGLKPGEKTGFEHRLTISYREGTRSRSLNIFLPDILVSSLVEQGEDIEDLTQWSNFHTQLFSSPFRIHWPGFIKTAVGSFLLLLSLIPFFWAIRKLTSKPSKAVLAPELAELQEKIQLLFARENLSDAGKIRKLSFILAEFLEKNPEYQENFRQLQEKVELGWAETIEPSLFSGVQVLLQETLRGGRDG